MRKVIEQNMTRAGFIRVTRVEGSSKVETEVMYLSVDNIDYVTKNLDGSTKIITKKFSATVDETMKDVSTLMSNARGGSK